MLITAPRGPSPSMDYEMWMEGDDTGMFGEQKTGVYEPRPPNHPMFSADRTIEDSSARGGTLVLSTELVSARS